jgi:hypothetical protein
MDSRTAGAVGNTHALTSPGAGTTMAHTNAMIIETSNVTWSIDL